MPRKEWSTATILRDALFKDVGTWTQQDESQVGKCMKKLGWKKRQVLISGVKSDREYQYYLPE